METLRLSKDGIKVEIETIKQFESKEARLYWIKRLNVIEAVKGLLIIHFKLI